MTKTINTIQRDTTKMTPEDAARTYLLSMPETGDVEGCINGCVNRLIEEKQLSEARARHIAMVAWAELRCMNSRSFIDVDHCTSRLVVVKTPEQVVYVPLDDLLMLATGLDGHDVATVH
ncbi:hypothetical protein LMG33818_002647 [Halomonadaceae bacterium LMG 33818]|uniref:hypothetical protein n=1 Tax=Cernens ardua TaxID=3402176 RepID=UPI003EDC1EFF